MYLRFRRTQDSERFPQTARIEFSYLASALPSILVFRLLPYGLSVIVLPIGKSLPNDTFYCPFSALHIVYAKPNAITVPKIIFCQIAVQMLLAAVLIDALHTALEDRIEAFDRVGVDVTANVFLLAVVHALMADELAANFEI